MNSWPRSLTRFVVSIPFLSRSVYDPEKWPKWEIIGTEKQTLQTKDSGFVALNKLNVGQNRKHNRVKSLARKANQESARVNKFGDWEPFQKQEMHYCYCSLHWLALRSFALTISKTVP